MTQKMILSNNFAGVDITYSEDVDREVDVNLYRALSEALSHADELTTFPLKTIHISCATDTVGHDYPSRHAQAKAVDISRINGKRMSEYAIKDPEVASLTAWLQATLHHVTYARENYGPFVKEKSGSPRSIGGHMDHIHFSVD